jgi:hypothetical protein
MGFIVAHQIGRESMTPLRILTAIVAGIIVLAVIGRGIMAVARWYERRTLKKLLDIYWELLGVMARDETGVFQGKP